MIHLREDQLPSLDAPEQPPVDPRTGQEYLLIRREIYVYGFAVSSAGTGGRDRPAAVPATRRRALRGCLSRSIRRQLHRISQRRPRSIAANRLSTRWMRWWVRVPPWPLSF